MTREIDDVSTALDNSILRWGETSVGPLGDLNSHSTCSSCLLLCLPLVTKEQKNERLRDPTPMLENFRSSASETQVPLPRAQSRHRIQQDGRAYREGTFSYGRADSAGSEAGLPSCLPFLASLGIHARAAYVHSSQVFLFLV